MGLALFFFPFHPRWGWGSWCPATCCYLGCTELSIIFGFICLSIGFCSCSFLNVGAFIQCFISVTNDVSFWRAKIRLLLTRIEYPVCCKFHLVIQSCYWARMGSWDLDVWLGSLHKNFSLGGEQKNSNVDRDWCDNVSNPLEILVLVVEYCNKSRSLRCS